MPYANKKSADQPAHPRSLIAPVIRFLDSIIPLVVIAKISSLYLVSVAEQASLSITWSEIPKTGLLVMWLSDDKIIIMHLPESGYLTIKG